MAEDDDRNHSRPSRGPVFKTIKLVVLLSAILLTTQIIYHPGPKRPTIICYPLASGMELAWVRVWSVFWYDEPITKMEHERNVNDFYNACLKTTSNWNWLKSF